jgi:hypothetical protein
LLETAFDFVNRDEILLSFAAAQRPQFAHSTPSASGYNGNTELLSHLTCSASIPELEETFNLLGGNQIPCAVATLQSLHFARLTPSPYRDLVYT